jgi:hypothetical protein
MNLTASDVWLIVLMTRAPQIVWGNITRPSFQIDRLVYDLHGLTDEEIKIVEGG